MGDTRHWRIRAPIVAVHPGRPADGDASRIPRAEHRDRGPEPTWFAPSLFAVPNGRAHRPPHPARGKALWDTVGTDDADGTALSAPDELLEILREQRRFLRLTVRGLDDEQATTRTTASELTLAGLVKHVALTERGWIDIMLQRPSQGPERNEETWGDDFRLVGEETLA